MKETTSVFWMDLGFRFRNKKRVPLQGSHRVTETLVMFLFLLYMLSDYFAVGPGSAPGV